MGASAIAAKPGERQLEVAHPVFFGFREMSAAHVDLDGRQNQARHVERGVTRFAHGGELILADVIMDMDIGTALLRHRGLPDVSVTARCLVVMAQEQATGFG